MYQCVAMSIFAIGKLVQLANLYEQNPRRRENGTAEGYRPRIQVCDWKRATPKLALLI